MKNYYRLMLGRKSAYAEQCFSENFIGADLSIKEDLSSKLPEAWREFNKTFIPIWLLSHPEKSKISAGLACGALWTVAKGIQIGDIVLCPDGSGTYRVCEVTGNYVFAPGQILPHRRAVRWFTKSIDRLAMSEALQNSTGSIGTISTISGYREEIENFLGDAGAPPLLSNDPDVENPTQFALEKHLEDFLIQNWKQTELGREYDIYEEEGEQVGQQYQTDTGPLDILAISKDKKKLLVVELKKGRASDVVVGQTLRYMGYVMDELAEEGQQVTGVIIALEEDQRIRRALSLVPSVSFYRYEISFKLLKN